MFPCSPAKASELGRQNAQKSLTKRLNGGQGDVKANKLCGPENLQHFFTEPGLINDRATDKVSCMITLVEDKIIFMKPA